MWAAVTGAAVSMMPMVGRLRAPALVSYRPRAECLVTAVAIVVPWRQRWSKGARQSSV